MIEKIEYPYRYSVIRYMHDRRTEEFVNIGVVLECASLGYVGCRFEKSLSRVGRFFPSAKVGSIRTAVKLLQAGINSRAESIIKCGEDMFMPKGKHIEGLWSSVLPRDDTTFIWSQVRPGLSADPDGELTRIFEKTVSAYRATQDKDSRSDADVWGVVEKHLSARNLRSRVVEHNVRGKVSEYNFGHSLRNGSWHCIEPVSVDLMKVESIRGKAQKIYGAMSLIKEVAQNTTVYFVLSKPTTSAAIQMFEEAKQIVDSVELPHSLIMEDEAEGLVDHLARVMSH